MCKEFEDFDRTEWVGLPAQRMDCALINLDEPFAAEGLGQAV